MFSERRLTYSTDLSGVRALVREQARDAGLAAARIIDLELAVSEVAANTLLHAADQQRERSRQRGHGTSDSTVDGIADGAVVDRTVRGTLRVWRTASEIVCEVRDSGVIADPRAAGERAPEPGALSGRGLWLVRQVCDQVEILSGAAGTMIRMHMALPPAAGRGGPPALGGRNSGVELLGASVTAAESDAGPYTLVVLSGEADVTNRDELRAMLEAEIAREPRTLVIDLGSLRFMDSSALHVILWAMRAMDRHGGVLALARPNQTVARMLHLTATDQLIPVYPTVGEAIAGLQV
jgi:anti-anti-sigma factor